jgi:hypothetical protein
MNKYDISKFPKVGSYSGNYTLPSKTTKPSYNAGGALRKLDLIQRYQTFPLPTQRQNETNAHYYGRVMAAGFLRGIFR